MNIRNLQGSIVAIVTPFKDTGEIDLETFDELIEFHIGNGTDGIVVCGTTGETPTLSDAEDAQMIERCVKKVNGRVPVIAGTGSNSTSDCIKYSKKAVELGADALLIVSPYYNKPSRRGIYKHFSQVAKNVDAPIILYNVPGRTGSVIEPGTAIELACNHKNIIGIKEAGGDMNVFAELLANRPEGFKVYSGDDFLSFPANCMGADGCISVVANLIPADFHKMMKTSIDGDLKTARSLFFKYRILMQLMFLESNPLPVKTALALMGKVSEVFRAPLCEMEDENREQLKIELKKLKLL
ncbi:MAG: 4-hydroxy-tetrahydrodipicolinate synthase [Anaerophaga sp.]|uniref:4-hydroxy-tetrahydrodipicolinate synthase n=1 Tax=Anaerophaga thermohalophila TaxID=177400 RepID=UPI000237D5CD|nr:4-hydroxy-tetrahydrodipicolinate synthase [Anaerophaga thermohalophila]MDN5291876.1 4-hydroxy-tetrahydrodipicolinate synthase [Anaerophaga sp.]